MPTIALVVDGEFDAAALREFAKRIRPECKILTSEAGRSVHKGTRILLALARRRPRIEFVVWVTDAESESPLDVKARMLESIKRVKLRISVKCVVAVPMLEAWLLAAELQDPKRELIRLLRNEKKKYTSEAARQLARKADLDIIAARCPSFNEFRETLRSL